jgi:hypothetical protein
MRLSIRINHILSKINIKQNLLKNILEYALLYDY